MVEFSRLQCRGSLQCPCRRHPLVPWSERFVIVVAFLFPLALYLLWLSWINRQERPVWVAGVWDFIGLLAAASGFLLVGGPAVLSSLHERWRLFWLFGQRSEATASLDAAFRLWLTLAVLYFLVVVTASAWGLWRSRAMSCIFNVDGDVFHRVLLDCCERVGFNPVQIGDQFLFELPSEPLPVSDRSVASQPASAAGDAAASPRKIVLKVDYFAPLHHVTMYWKPADSPVRLVIERELRRRLREIPAPDHDTGSWFGLLGSFLLVIGMLILFVLAIYTALR